MRRLGLFSLHYVVAGNSFALSMMAAFWVLIVLVCAFPVNAWNVAFEVRELRRTLAPGMARFAPWSEITDVRWLAVRTFLGVPLRYKGVRRFAGRRFTLPERDIAKGQKDAVTAALARFAPVYDTTARCWPGRNSRETRPPVDRRRGTATAGGFNSISKR